MGIESCRCHTQSFSSVFSRSMILGTTRSAGIPYGCSPWKGVAASVFDPLVSDGMLKTISQTVLINSIWEDQINIDGKESDHSRFGGAD
jgi:hypothetical protein